MEGMVCEGIYRGRRVSLVEVEPAFRSETRTRLVIGKRTIHGRAEQVAS